MSSSARLRRRNRRGQGVKLRDEIVEAALRLIDAGHDPITLRAVAREAGISAPSIYDHFEDLEQIEATVVGTCFVELTAAIVAARDAFEDPVKRLEAGCRAYLTFAERQPHRYALLFRRERPPELSGSGLEGSGEAAFGTLVEGVADCAAAGRSASRDPFSDAVALWSGLHGYASLRTARSGFPWPEDELTLRRIVHGLARISDGQ